MITEMRIRELIAERRRYSYVSIVISNDSTHCTVQILNIGIFFISDKDLREQINRILNYIDDYYGYKVIVQSIDSKYGCDSETEQSLENIDDKFFYTSSDGREATWDKRHYKFVYTDTQRETIDIDGHTYYKDEVVEHVASLKKVKD